MSTKYVLIILLLITFLSCGNEEDQVILNFVNHARSLNIDELKDLCTEETRFLIKVMIEPVVRLGDDNAVDQLKHIVSTLECSEFGSNYKCSYINDTGNEHIFYIHLIQDYNTSGEKKLLVNIDKKYFFGQK